MYAAKAYCKKTCGPGSDYLKETSDIKNIEASEEKKPLLYISTRMNGTERGYSKC